MPVISMLFAAARLAVQLFYWAAKVKQFIIVQECAPGWARREPDIEAHRCALSAGRSGRLITGARSAQQDFGRTTNSSKIDRAPAALSLPGAPI